MEINYSGSGIKTLRMVSVFSFIVHLVLAVICVGVFADINYIAGGGFGVMLGLILFFNGLFIMAVGFVLSTIAESVLYSKQKQEHSELWDD